MEYNEVLCAINQKICDITNKMPQYAPKEYNDLKTYIIEKLGTDYSSSNSEDLEHSLIISCVGIYRENSNVLRGYQSPIKYNKYGVAYRKLLCDKSEDIQAELVSSLAPHFVQIGYLWDKAYDKLAQNTSITPLLITISKQIKTHNGSKALLLITVGTLLTTCFGYGTLGFFPSLVVWGVMMTIYKAIKKEQIYEYSIDEKERKRYYVNHT